MSAVIMVVALIDAKKNVPLVGAAFDEDASAIRARELIKQSRLAAGLEGDGNGIQTLKFTAKSQRFIKYVSVQSPTKVEEKEKTLSGKIQAEFSLPDKFRVKTSSDTLNGFDVSYTEIINGDEAWRNPPMQVRSFGSDSRVIDVGDIERTLLMQTRTAKQQISLYTLGWVLNVPPSLQTEMSHAGTFDFEGQACDGIIVDGQDGFRSVLLIDQKTRLLAAMAMLFYDATRETVIVEVAGFNRRYIRDTYMKAREERQARMKPPRRHEMVWKFMDRSTVGGVSLPHRVKITFDGRLVEELTINEYEVNQPINPKRFNGKPEVKY
ncbi:MAG: hypothetical protein AB7I31_21300 [Blastocatellales bacterium]